MVDEDIVAVVRDYLSVLVTRGIVADFAVVFGSTARGRSDQWSDIDLVVVSRHFDGDYERSSVNQLWRAAARVDSRIEPIPCGPGEWRQESPRAVIEIARNEGQIIRYEVAA
jgi:uncharacterized protein